MPTMDDPVSVEPREGSSPHPKWRVWRRQGGPAKGFGTADRVIVRAIVVLIFCEIFVGSAVDQYVRNWVGRGGQVDKQLYEYTSLSKEDYGDLSQRWKQVLAEALVGDNEHLPSAIDLLRWIEPRDLNAIEKVAPFVLNFRAVYAEDLTEISAFSGVDVGDLARLVQIGFVDEPPGAIVDVWDSDSGGLLGGDNVFLAFCERGKWRFGLPRMTLTPAGAYIMRLLDRDTDVPYLLRLADEIEKKGADVEMYHGDIEYSDGGILVTAKSKLPWKQFQSLDDDRSD